MTDYLAAMGIDTWQENLKNQTPVQGYLIIDDDENVELCWQLLQKALASVERSPASFKCLPLNAFSLYESAIVDRSLPILVFSDREELDSVLASAAPQARFPNKLSQTFHDANLKKQLWLFLHQQLSS